MIMEVSKYVQEITNSYVQNNKPIVGANAFKHEAGIHQAGVINNKETYEIINPIDYGIYTDNIIIGIHSGKNAIINKMEKMKYDISKYDISYILNDVKTYCTTHSNIDDENLEKIIVKRKIKK